MRNISNFEDYILSMVLESNTIRHNIKEIPIIFSKRLIDILMLIKHPIAKELIKMDFVRDYENITFIDIDEKDNTVFTAISSSKAYGALNHDYNKDNKEGEEIENLELSDIKDTFYNIIIDKEITDEEYWKKNRMPIKIGSFIKKFFNDEYKQAGDPGNDIETFVKAVVAKRLLMENGSRFKIVDGEDITKYYNEEKYETTNTDGRLLTDSTLMKSCMRQDYKSSYINFLVINNIQMLVLFSDIDGNEDKIVGRALLWNLDVPENRVFMDRIYYNSEVISSKFKDYAEQKGWLYKRTQNSMGRENIVDGAEYSDSKPLTMVVKNIKITNKFPYIDTLKYLNIDNLTLTNDEDECADECELYYMLEGLDGDYEKKAGNKAYFSEYYDENISKVDLIFCMMGNDYRKKEDCKYIHSEKKYATDEYIDENMSWSEFEKSYLFDDDCYHSTYHDDYIRIEDAIGVCNGYDAEDMGEFDVVDFVHKNFKNDLILYKNDKLDGDYYFGGKNVSNYFIEVSVGDGKKEYKHKYWDEDKLYRFKNEWYYDFDKGVTKDQIIGQQRLWDK